MVYHYDYENTPLGRRAPGHEYSRMRLGPCPFDVSAKVSNVALTQE